MDLLFTHWFQFPSALFEKCFGLTTFRRKKIDWVCFDRFVFNPIYSFSFSPISSRFIEYFQIVKARIFVLFRSWLRKMWKSRSDEIPSLLFECLKIYLPEKRHRPSPVCNQPRNAFNELSSVVNITALIFKTSLLWCQWKHTSPNSIFLGFGDKFYRS